MWQHRSKRWLFFFLFLLGLLNRESIAFLIPWFAFISLQGQERKGRGGLELLIGFGLVLAIYYLFRIWINSHATVPLDFSYYLNPILDKPMRMFRQTFPYHPLGLFSVFKLLWIFPVLAVISYWKNKNYSELTGMGLLLFCSWAQLLIAYDSSRMFALGFMIVIIALCHLLETNRFNFRQYAFWAVGLNLLVPQPYTANKIIEIWRSFLTSMIL